MTVAPTMLWTRKDVSACAPGVKRSNCSPDGDVQSATANDGRTGHVAKEDISPVWADFDDECDEAAEYDEDEHANEELEHSHRGGNHLGRVCAIESEISSYWETQRGTRSHSLKSSRMRKTSTEVMSTAA